MNQSAATPPYPRSGGRQRRTGAPPINPGSRYTDQSRSVPNGAPAFGGVPLRIGVSGIVAILVHNRLELVLSGENTLWSSIESGKATAT